MKTWRNTENSYGLVSIAIHWLVAVLVIGLFVLGLWMVSLTYYDPWYRRGPDLHKSIGVLLFLLMLFRLIWRNWNTSPLSLGSDFENRAAFLTHIFLYVLLIALIVSGYFISTADGRGIEVFGVVTIPATLSGFANQEDIAGLIHEVLAYVLIGLSLLHAGAALKHHIMNKDMTLKRMFGIHN